MKWILPTLTICTCLFACTNNHTKNNVPGTVAALNIKTDSSSNFETSIVNSADIKTVSGLLYSYQDRIALKICGEKSSVTLLDPDKVVQIAYQKINDNFSYDNESVYAELKVKKKSKDTIIVNEIIKLKPKTAETACFLYEFLASGTEPFWSLEIIPDENLISLKDVSANKTYLFPYQKAVKIAEEFSYTTKNVKGEILEIKIKKENCNDGMTDRNYLYSSQIIINGKVLNGCALKKGNKI